MLMVYKHQITYTFPKGITKNIGCQTYPYTLPYKFQNRCIGKEMAFELSLEHELKGCTNITFILNLLELLFWPCEGKFLINQEDMYYIVT